MDFIIDLLTRTALQVWTTFTHNWPFLLISVLISVALKLYVDPVKVSALLTRYRRVGVLGATAAAVTTPLCSCGTTAVVLGMMASMIPWAPIIAFMVASPLTSPEELIYSAGLFGWPFALAFFFASIVLGLLGGLAGEILERRGWLANQARFAGAQPEPAARATAEAISPAQAQFPARLAARPLQLAGVGAGAGNISLCCGPVELPAAVESAKAPASSCGCGAASVPATTSACGCSTPTGQAATPAASSACGCSTPTGQAATPAVSSPCGCSGAEQAAEPAARPRVTARAFLNEAWTTGKRLLVMFLGFAFIGYLLNGLIPSAWVAALFGKGSIYSVPLAATLGLPFYINTEGSLPLVRALIDGGMSQGAALAFLITGAGTSIGAMAGALTIARWRVITVVIGTLWAGAVLLGYLYNALWLAGLF